MMLITNAHAGGAFDGFGGRWVGNGSIVMSDSKSEAIKCIATYFPSAGGTHLRMNVRCASPGYKIDAVGNLTEQGAYVFGTFEERNYNSSGKVSGTAGDGSISAFISGADWRASLSVTGNGARVILTPIGSVVKRVTITFHKG